MEAIGRMRGASIAPGVSIALVNIAFAGKAGILLSALSQSEEVAIDQPKVEALAKANGINAKLELPTILKSLEDRKLVAVGKAGVGVLGVTSAQILQHAAGIFDSLAPTADEHAVIELAEQTSQTPLDTKAAGTYLADTFKIRSSDASDLLTRAEEVGFVDGEDIDKQTHLLFRSRDGEACRGEPTSRTNGTVSSSVARFLARFPAPGRTWWTSWPGVLPLVNLGRNRSAALSGESLPQFTRRLTPRRRRGQRRWPSPRRRLRAGAHRCPARPSGSHDFQATL